MAKKNTFRLATLTQRAHPRSICFLTTGLGYGGADVQVANLARTLSRRGWSVRLVSLIPLHELGQDLKREGFVVESLQMSPGIPDPRAVLRLARLLRLWRPDILHCHMVHANLLGRITRLFVEVPVLISTAHNINEGGKLRELAYRLTDPLTDLTTNVSHSAVQRYIAVRAAPKPRIRMMPNGVDTDRFRPDRDARRRLRDELGVGDAFAWLAVGRLEAAKDYGTMLNAFAQSRRDSDAKLFIVGTGSLFDPIQAMARQLGLSDAVRFLGVRKDVSALMNAADGYLMSSAWEGMPLVLIEAAATGLPMVATDVGGNAEIVLDGENGFLSPPGDSAALASAMIRMMHLPQHHRKRMAETARSHVVENHGIEAVATQWEAIYQELYDSSSRRTPSLTDAAVRGRQTRVDD